MKKQLLIFTSRSHDEWSNFWQYPEDQLIVHKGLDYFDSAKNQWDFSAIEKLINDNCLVLIHGKGEKKVRKKANGITYSVHFYSTQNKNSDSLWSFKDYKERWDVPENEPERPLDRLCWNLYYYPSDKEKVSESVRKIIDHFEFTNLLKYYNTSEKIIKNEETINRILESICNNNLKTELQEITEKMKSIEDYQSDEYQKYFEYMYMLLKNAHIT